MTNLAKLLLQVPLARGGGCTINDLLSALGDLVLEYPEAGQYKVQSEEERDYVELTLSPYDKTLTLETEYIE